MLVTHGFSASQIKVFFLLRSHSNRRQFDSYSASDTAGRWELQRTCPVLTHCSVVQCSRDCTVHTPILILIMQRGEKNSDLAVGNISCRSGQLSRTFRFL